MLKYMGWSLADVSDLTLEELGYWFGHVNSLIIEENREWAKANKKKK